MCGIFGVLARKDSGFSPGTLKTALNDLFILSESRGKEAGGLAVIGDDAIRIFKQPVSASRMIRSSSYRRFFQEAFHSNGNGKTNDLQGSIAAFGHSRLVTNGAQVFHRNNQPVIYGGTVGIHNGIVVNEDELWRKHPSLKRSSDVDTEVILGLMELFRSKNGNLEEAVRSTFKSIVGTASVAIGFAGLNAMLLATNNGSLYLCTNRDYSIRIFASERHILEMLVRKRRMRALLGDCTIRPIPPGEAILIDLDTLESSEFELSGERPRQPDQVFSESRREIIDAVPAEERCHDTVEAGGNLRAGLDREGIEVYVPSEFHRHIDEVRSKVSHLRRCSECLLPETMPFIDFDEQGVCNYCRNYLPLKYLGMDALRDKIAGYRKTNGEPDCVVTFSGGRDSSYGLHVIRKELGLNLVAYTYDWGMVNDLARRNQARMCGKLGIEHILISADIRKKRNNIRKNVIAWLHRPRLGTVPLFMAGDKQYFYYANRLMNQTGIKLVAMCENLLETTQFKSGFCGVRPLFGTNHTYTMSIFDKLIMASYYGIEFLLNPSYLNSSMLDTVHAFFSYYMIPHNYLNIYNYLRWDEEEINRVLLEEYDWETAGDTSTTWRIGDGTASFYNYIYYVVAGFNENDTFRSNQVRNGMMTREKALQTIEDENQPRYESMKWYCDTIGIDFEQAVGRINRIPKLYDF